jgi:hypothetical protein
MSSTTMTTKGNNGGTWHFLLSGFEALIEQRQLQLSALSSRHRLLGSPLIMQLSHVQRDDHMAMHANADPLQRTRTQPLGDVPNGNLFVEIELFRLQKSQAMSFGENISLA